MPFLDYVALCNYYKVKDVMAKLEADTAAAKGAL